jgi:NAD(P)-dependent dehydrogenase (short-subunit alcohol dehydrogenase family)
MSDGKIILITGSTDGIGLGTALALARQGHTILVHGRDPEKIAVTCRRIMDETRNERVEGYLGDFSALANVRRLAAEIGARHDRIDILINNAGIGGGGHFKRELSADGFEVRFHVNHLAPFLLQHLLLPLVQRAAPSRIVNVASGAQMPIDFSDVMLEKSYTGFQAYSQSKLAMVMTSFDLAARLDPSRVTVNALHPGTMLNTKLVRAIGKPQGSVEIGIEAEVYLATSREVAGVSGGYFDRLERTTANAQAYDPDARAKLWALSEKLVGITLTTA